MTFNGHVQNGAVVLVGPIPLPDGTVVEVVVRPAATTTEAQPNLWERMKHLVGRAEGLPEDASTKTDH